jgi:hypothetical protein
LIDEETSGAGRKEPAWSGIKDHNSKKIGVPSSGFATAEAKAGEGAMKTRILGTNGGTS